MSARWINSLPENFNEAEGRGLKKVPVDFDAMSEEESQQWRSISHSDGRRGGCKIVPNADGYGSKCYYPDPNTGEYNRRGTAFLIPNNYHKRDHKRDHK
jgi:hypothetical protein